MIYAKNVFMPTLMVILPAKKPARRSRVDVAERKAESKQEAGRLLPATPPPAIQPREVFQFPWCFCLLGFGLASAFDWVAMCSYSMDVSFHSFLTVLLLTSKS